MEQARARLAKGGIVLTSLLEARMSGLSQVAGACNNSPEFRGLLNDATRELLQMPGDWSGSLVQIFVCIRSGCVVFPRYVGSVRKINMCGSHVAISNIWNPYVGGSWGHFFCSNLSGLSGSPVKATSIGKTATFSSVAGEGRLIRAYIQVQADIGKHAWIFGIDNDGQTLREEQLDGTWTEGIKLTFAMPFTSTATYVRRIDRVLKDETSSDVRLYAWDDANSVLEDITLMQPSETNPSLMKFKLSFCGESCATRPIHALVKLAFVPAKHDTDLVLIGNLTALEIMMQGIKLRRAGDRQGYVENKMLAIQTLNDQQHDELPDDQITVNFGEVPLSVGTQRAW